MVRGRGVYTILKGYMDESSHKDVFTLCGLLANGTTWTWFNSDWLNVIDKTNGALVAQGRKQIRRYHATDCAGFHRDFKDWSRDEQIALTKSLIEVFRKPTNALYVFSFALRLSELEGAIPEVSPDPVGAAYVILLMALMDEISHQINEANNGDLSLMRVALVHERCNYNATLQRGFDRSRALSQRNNLLFTTLTPMGWEDCTPLQPTDLLAFETCKEVERMGSTRPNMRECLKQILHHSELAGVAKHYTKENLESMKREWLTPELLQQLLLDANIVKQRQAEHAKN